MRATKVSRAVLGMAGGGLLSIALIAPPVIAHDDTDTGPIGMYGSADYFIPSGARDQAFNSYRVFLSSPRHTDSGSRGECLPPSHNGYEENINGRKFNWYAANGNFMSGNYHPNNKGRNLHSRGYKVTVSANSRDGDWLANRSMSQNWGSHVHIISHTNAVTGGCHSGSNYLLTMYEHGNDHVLADNLDARLNPAVPGSASH